MRTLFCFKSISHIDHHPQEVRSVPRGSLLPQAQGYVQGPHAVYGSDLEAQALDPGAFYGLDHDLVCQSVLLVEDSPTVLVLREPSEAHGFRSQWWFVRKHGRRRNSLMRHIRPLRLRCLQCCMQPRLSHTNRSCSQCLRSWRGSTGWCNHVAEVLWVSEAWSYMPC